MWDTLFPKLWLIQPTHAWFNQRFFSISLWLFIEKIEPQFHTFTVSKICINLRSDMLQNNCLVLTCLSWKRVRALLRGSTVPQGAYIEEQRVDSVKREKVRSGPQVCLGGALIIAKLNLFAFGFVNRQIQKTQQGNLTWGRPYYRQTKSCLLNNQGLSVWVVLQSSPTKLYDTLRVAVKAVQIRSSSIFGPNLSNVFSPPIKHILLCIWYISSVDEHFNVVVAVVFTHWIQFVFIPSIKQKLTKTRIRVLHSGSRPSNLLS